MRYTHIGIEDQARTLANLPNPCQHIVSIPGDFEGQTLASPVINGQHKEEMRVDVKSGVLSLCDTEKQKESSGDSWRWFRGLARGSRFAKLQVSFESKKSPPLASARPEMRFGF